MGIIPYSGLEIVRRVSSIILSSRSTSCAAMCMGRWTIISTLPGVKSKESGGRILKEFLTVMGSMGSPVSMAKIKAPFLKGMTFPSRLLVPSAKKSIDDFWDNFSLALSIDLMAAP